MVDYGIARAKYLERFVETLECSEVSKRLEKNFHSSRTNTGPHGLTFYLPAQRAALCARSTISPEPLARPAART